MALPEDPVLAAAEPDELSAIRALRPDGSRDLHWNQDADTLYDRIYAAWLTRCVGCAMGKPVEGCGMTPLPDGSGAFQHGRSIIAGYLRKRGAYPLDNIILENAVELVNPPDRLLLSIFSCLSWLPIWCPEIAAVAQLQGAR